MKMQNKIIKDRYEVLEILGEGGMATIILAKDLVLDQLVALKKLKVEDIKTIDTNLKRFKNEAKIISSISSLSNNLVHIYDYFSEGQYEYIVMEYVPGENLKEALQRRVKYHYTEATQILLEIAKGLRDIHSKGIVHRDLKPENILIQKDTTIKITDFGISIFEGQTHGLTKVNAIIGSVQYIAPEAIVNKKLISKTTDIYSLGVIYYEMLTGTNPFYKADMYDILRDQIKRKVPLINKRYPQIPTSIDYVIQKCTSKNIQGRYQDINEVINDLETILEDKNNKLIPKGKNIHNSSIPRQWRKKISKRNEKSLNWSSTKKNIFFLLVVLVILIAIIITTIILIKP